MACCILGVGANLGDRDLAVRKAVELIGRLPQVTVQATSRWVETEPVGGPPGQPAFINGAVRLETQLTPHELLAATLDIERQFGRHREIRWAPRTVDIDLLLFDDAIIDEPQLVVPHPWMSVRRFVAGPAAEIAPEWIHPAFGWTLQRLWQNLLIEAPWVAMVGIAAAEQAEIARRVAGKTGMQWVSLQAAGAELAVPSREPSLKLAESLRQATLRNFAACHGGRGGLLDSWWETPLAKLSDEGYDRFVAERRTKGIDEETPAAQLKIILDPSPAALTGTARRRHQQLRKIVTAPGKGPYLTLETTDLSRLEHDLTAAILGMR